LDVFVKPNSKIPISWELEGGVRLQKNVTGNKLMFVRCTTVRI